ncbi:hypothetical protein BC827DRAFT_1214630 [Russula dissimulans]|nr:hypothetical protein BC827DRAFT_1214630 [Russula dissimulans]
MENNFSRVYAPHIVGSVVSVAGNVFGKGLVNYISPRRQEQRGDYYADQSRGLLEQDFKIIPPDNRKSVFDEYDRVLERKEHLENHSFPGFPSFQKLSTAKEYKRLAKQTYHKAKRESEKARDNNLRIQMAGATRDPQVKPGNTIATTSTHSNPFTNSHAISQLTNESVDGLTAVEMTRYDAEATGEAAAVKGASGWPKKTNGSPLTSRPASQSGAPGAAVDLSVHREDGTSSHLVLTPSPGDRTNEDGERKCVQASLFPRPRLKLSDWGGNSCPSYELFMSCVHLHHNRRYSRSVVVASKLILSQDICYV